MIRDVIGKTQLKGHHDFINVLVELASKSRTSKMWVDVLIKPVHLQAVKLMMPYFFASRHVNYARYGLYYLRSMEDLPTNILEHFMKGAHVMRHVPGLWNGLWSDMFIEPTFMWYGHGKFGYNWHYTETRNS